MNYTEIRTEHYFPTNENKDKNDIDGKNDKSPNKQNSKSNKTLTLP